MAAKGGGVVVMGKPSLRLMPGICHLIINFLHNDYPMTDFGGICYWDLVSSGVPFGREA